MSLGSDRWPRFTIAMDDSTFALTPARRGRGMELPMSGDEIEQSEGQATVEVRLRWRDLNPRIERSVEGGGKIEDTFELVAEDTIVVKRSFSVTAPMAGISVKGSMKGLSSRKFRFPSGV